MQIQKQGNILLPQEFNQLIILTAVKNSNDGYFTEVSSKTYIIFLVFSLYLRNLKFSKDQPLQKSLIQCTDIPGPNGSAEVCLATRIIAYFYSIPDSRIILTIMNYRKTFSSPS